MTLISSDIGAPHQLGHSLAGAIVNRIAKAVKRRRRQRDKRDLSRIPDHILRDVGLEHMIAQRGTKRPDFWR